jgi:membrane protein implicated in regulation of membrane protease activity
MYPLFVGALLLGLLIGVFSMLHGVERDEVPSAAGAASARSADPSAALTLPLLAAFATAFGLSGSLMARYSTLPTTLQVVVGALIGALGAGGAAALVLKWAIPSAREEVIDERYRLQGQPARVVEAITLSSPGIVEYAVEGAHVRAQARSFDGSSVAAGTEVVIERVEDGMMYVELWALVEQRL